MIGFTSNVTVTTKKDVKDLMKDLMALSDNRVLVGVPTETSPRIFLAGKKPMINNATLAFIHDKGSPKANIPARPFMKPGIAKAQNRINTEFKAAAQARMAQNDAEVDIRLHRAGLIAQNSIRNVIRIGENFAPLKRGTLLGRTRGRAYLWYHLTKAEMEGASKAQKKAMRGAKREAIMGSLHPLVDTGQLLKSVVYVIENKETGTRQVGKQSVEGAE